MTEIEKLLENANTYKMLCNCEFKNLYDYRIEYGSDVCDYTESKIKEPCKVCEKAKQKIKYYPDFTAEKQLKIVKFLLHKGVYYDTDGDTYWFHFTDEIENATYRPFEEAIAELINTLWQSLTDQEKEEIRGILNDDRFKFIKNFEKYSACRDGHIYSNDYNHTGKRKILKEYIDKDGYPYVTFVIKWKRYKKIVHRLIAETFIENTHNKSQVNHKNGNKLDNRVDNLEWVTAKENINHAYKVLGKKPTKQMIKDFTKRVRGENNPKSKIDYRTACIIRKDRARGIMLKYIARKFDISISQVSAICNNKFWKSNIYENKELLNENC